MRWFSRGHDTGWIVDWVVRRWVWIFWCALAWWWVLGLWVATVVIWVEVETKTLV
jgi:hypothetical protein